MNNYELSGMFMRLMARRRNRIWSMNKDEPLQMGQLPLLGMIKELAGCSQNTLAEKLNITPASVALSCKRLEQAGLIERRVDRSNRRCNMLFVTPKGHEVAVRCKRNFDAVDSLMYGGLSEQECAALANMLVRMTDALGESGVDEPCWVPPMMEEKK